MGHSTGTSKLEKPAKPYPGFPLGPANNGKWQKRIRGTLYYFGRWAKVVNGKLERIPGDGWQDALASYEKQAADLHAGRKPRNSDGLTVMDLANKFLTAKTRKVESRELSPETFRMLKRTTDKVVAALGNRLVTDLDPEDFGELRAVLSKGIGVERLCAEINRARAMFGHAYKNGLIERPVRYGDQFDKPSKDVRRRHRGAKPKNFLEASDWRRMLKVNSPETRAVLLLGLNCGYGPIDCELLRASHIDLETGWACFPRPKTGIERRCPLWEETKAALVAIADGERFFSATSTNITKRVVVRMKTLKLHAKGRGAYTARHTFRTKASGARDEPAARLIMGHATPGIEASYVEHIEDSRLVAITEHVHQWLFGGAR